jgi:hypothetical protein
LAGILGDLIDHETFARLWAEPLLAGASNRHRLLAKKVDDLPPFDLTEPWLTSRWGGDTPCCEVSGHVFTTDRVERALVKRPFAPSLDQIVPGGGYTQANTRVVCVLVNFAMGEWGEGYLRQIVASMVENNPAHLLENAEKIWTLTMAARIDEAARAAAVMAGEPVSKTQRKRLAGLRATLTKGRAGLREAAAKAVQRRQRAADYSSVVA